MNKTPAPTGNSQPSAREKSSASDIAAFLDKARTVKPGAGGRGRVVFALDATMSRQPTWDMAMSIQGEMFDAVREAGGLEVQLVYYRGLSESAASKWVSDAASLKTLMTRIDCRGGHTQIRKILRHAATENAKGKVSAVIFIGDAMEEGIDDILQAAGELGLRGVPVFVFQEGVDPQVEFAFREIARITRGAWFRFDRNASEVLARLLASIALYATGGLKALESRGSREDRLLISRLGGAGGQP